MRDVFPVIEDWVREGKGFAVAFVTKTWGSSPRETGSWMVVSETGEFVGSVSGGCVESAVIEEAMDAIENKHSRNIHFGVTDETAWEVGLACGGKIDVFVRPFSPDVDMDQAILRSINEGIVSNNPFLLAIVLNGPQDLIGHIELVSELGRAPAYSVDSPLGLIHEKAKEIFLSRSSQVATLQLKDEETEVFFNVYTTPLKLVIVGGVHISIALAACAKILGYQVYVIDPRGAFGTSERFSEVDGLVEAWPDRGLEEVGLDAFTAVAVLSHDPKLDDPAIGAALRSDAFYIGALGSRKTQQKRRERLIGEGFGVEELERLYGPIGLDLGGSSPEEIALSIMAEIVSVRARSN